MSGEERMQRESTLIATIRKKLPEFAEAWADDMEVVLFHQDALAADYQEDEYAILGMAIKYAGLRGRRSACDRQEPKHTRQGIKNPVNAMVRCIPACSEVALQLFP
jgi:hypothetical protein